MRRAGLITKHYQIMTKDINYLETSQTTKPGMAYEPVLTAIYCDISSIIKRLDTLFIEKYSNIKTKELKCRHCGKISNEVNFRYMLISRDKKYMDTCLNCWDEITAKKGLYKTLSVFLEIPYNAYDEECNYSEKLEQEIYEKRDIINKIITPEILKMKIILNKLTNKLKNYDASKH